MNNMGVKLIIDEYQTELDDSKFFGEILLPNAWLEENVFSPTEMFLCQINLEQLYTEIGETLLPKTGILYFFIDYGKKLTAKVRYFDGDLDGYTCFNEDWEDDFDAITDLSVEFAHGEDGVVLLANTQDLFGDDVCLLKVNTADEDVLDINLAPNKTLYFMIDKKALLSRNFDKVVLKIL